jgi:hypothetical protein
MNIIIQCQGRKRETLPFVQRQKKVKFIAQPTLYTGHECAVRPETEISGTSNTWRDEVSSMNEDRKLSKHLLPASSLYQHDIYRTLANNFGAKNTYILSAGWGLVRSDFALPSYDITFSNVPKAQKYKFRSKHENWHDFNHLNLATTQPLVFFGSNSYLPSLISLTTGYKGEKFAFCAAQSALATLESAGFRTIRFESYTNWHYSAAKKYGTREMLSEKIKKR